MDDVKKELLELLNNFHLELRDRMGPEPYFPQSGRVAAAALVGAIRSVEAIIMDRLDQEARANVLRALREWVADMGALLPEEERIERERRLRSPELQAQLNAWCAEIRAPGPDVQGPYCLILVGLSDKDWADVADHVGDGYTVHLYQVDGDWALGPRSWHLGSAAEGLQGQDVYLVEVAP